MYINWPSPGKYNQKKTKKSNEYLHNVWTLVAFWHQHTFNPNTMDLWSIINIILNLLTSINSIVTILICLSIFLLVGIFHHQSRSVPLLLACHTCFILLISSYLLASMVKSSLFGFLSISLEQHGDTKWCHWRGFLIHAVLCVLYDSYILQAIYRFCRIVLHQYKHLYTFSLYCFLIFIESVFGILSISPVFIGRYVVYLSTEYYCQTPFTNIPAILYIACRLFLLPIILISIIYICLVKHLRQINFYHHRSKSNRRNLIIIRRILMMLTVLILLGLPSMIFLIIYMLTGHFVSITYRVGWLSVSFSLVFLAYMLIQLTRTLRKTVRIICQCKTSRY
jgi:hypothetical protein